MKQWFQNDERTERMADRLGFIFLGLTQMGLYLALVYQRYVEELPTAYYNDVALILILSAVGYWGARFFFGGFQPRLSPKKLLVIYLIAVAVIAVPHTFVHGWPGRGEWLGRILPIFGLPALLVGFYAVLSYLGNRRIEQRLTQAE